MNQKVYVICGTPGSGKSWVCNQLQDKWRWIKHDEHYKDHAQVIIEMAKKSDRPLVTEVPFAERKFMDEMRMAGIVAIPYFIVESPQVIKERYETREGKPIPQNNLTRALSIKQRAIEWSAPYGTSIQILAVLQKV